LTSVTEEYDIHDKNKLEFSNGEQRRIISENKFFNEKSEKTIIQENFRSLPKQQIALSTLYPGNVKKDEFRVTHIYYGIRIDCGPKIL